MTDLTKITTPTALLDDETREALKAHGGPYEFWDTYYAKWVFMVLEPIWTRGFIYRVAYDKDTINWDQVADEFICMAREEAGIVWIYTDPPKKTDFTWRGIRCGRKVRRADAFSSYKRGTCPWEDSLVFRPGHEPKGEER